jgi:hypothetical protein
VCSFDVTFTDINGAETGGVKASQTKDITKAKKMASELKRAKR